MSSSSLPLIQQINVIFEGILNKTESVTEYVTSSLSSIQEYKNSLNSKLQLPINSKVLVDKHNLESEGKLYFCRIEVGDAKKRLDDYQVLEKMGVDSPILYLAQCDTYVITITDYYEFTLERWLEQNPSYLPYYTFQCYLVLSQLLITNRFDLKFQFKHLMIDPKSPKDLKWIDFDLKDIEETFTTFIDDIMSYLRRSFAGGDDISIFLNNNQEMFTLLKKSIGNPSYKWSKQLGFPKAEIEGYPWEIKRAYVWCVFGGNAYIPGAVVSAHSVSLTGTKYDLVCMYTDDVTDLDTLSKCFTKLIKIPYLQFPSKRMKTDKQQNIYESWMDRSYTKMNILSLVQYEKALFMDADTVVLQNIDSLFELSAPAGTFSSPWGSPYVKNGISLEMYPKSHGSTVTPVMVEKAVTSGGVAVIGTTMLIAPNMDDYNRYIAYIKANLPYGLPNCHSVGDEQSITYYFSKIKGVNWTFIHQSYNFIPWKKNWLPPTMIDGKRVSTTPSVYHFFNKEKPWMMSPAEWPDLKDFYQFAKDMIAKHPSEVWKSYFPTL